MAALLELRQVTRSFGGLLALDAVDLKVEQGSLVALIGPNGAGKTTAFNVITGLYPPDRGQVVVGGRDVAGLPPHRIAAHGIARTFQNIRLFSSLTVLQNVLVGAHLKSDETLTEALISGAGHTNDERELRDRAVEALQALGIERYAGEKASNLPYGEQRRLEIARALVSGPTLLLLDEPAAGLNPGETMDLMRTIGKLRDEHGLTVLLIEHDMRFVMAISEHICVLDYGRVIAEGMPEAIRTNPVVIEAYLGQAPA